MDKLSCFKGQLAACPMDKKGGQRLHSECCPGLPPPHNPGSDLEISPTQAPRLPAVPEAGRAAARADLLHAQGEAQEAAQSGGNPEDLAALQSTGVKESERLKGGPAATARPGPTQPTLTPSMIPPSTSTRCPSITGAPEPGRQRPRPCCKGKKTRRRQARSLTLRFRAELAGKRKN